MNRTKTDQPMHVVFDEVFVIQDTNSGFYWGRGGWQDDPETFHAFRRRPEADKVRRRMPAADTLRVVPYTIQYHPTPALRCSPRAGSGRFSGDW